MRQRLTGVLCAVSAFVVLASCGGGGGGTGPTPTPTSITVTSLGNNLILGQTETFTAMFALSNGTSQPLTGGTWGTDAPGVATVNPATGLVTGISAGEVTIFVDAQGLRGSKRITIATYNGMWRGAYSITACTQTGDFATPAINLCGLFTVGSQPQVTFNMTQVGTTVTGQVGLGTLEPSPFTTVFAPNGSLAFQAVFIDDTFSLVQAWQLSIGTGGQLTGTVVQTWTDSTLTGQMVVSGTLVSVLKISADQAQDRRTGTVRRSLAEVAAAVIRR